MKTKEKKKLLNFLNNCFWTIFTVFIAIVLITVVFIIIKKTPIKYEDNSLIKEEAIQFLNENINEIEPICTDLMNNKKDKCTKWGYCYICYHNETITISESGLTTPSWELKYSNNRWYSVEKRSYDMIDITDYIKKP